MALTDAHVAAGEAAKRALKALNERTAEEKEEANAKDAETHAKLKRHLRSRENQKCADCQTQYAGWAALPHGVFLCIDCAQLHRGIGRHISQVKAVNTGTYLWYDDEVDVMVSNGNALANHVLLARHPDGVGAQLPMQGSHTARMRFLSQKYEERRWARRVEAVVTADAEVGDGTNDIAREAIASDSRTLCVPRTPVDTNASRVVPSAVPETLVSDEPAAAPARRTLRKAGLPGRRRSPLRAQKVVSEDPEFLMPFDDVEAVQFTPALAAPCGPSQPENAAPEPPAPTTAEPATAAYDAKVTQIMALYQEPVRRGQDGHLQYQAPATAPTSFFSEYGL